MGKFKLIVRFLYNVNILFVSKIKSIFFLGYQQITNPTCIIHKDAQIINSKLNKHNVVFNYASLINSTIDSHSYIQRNSCIINTSVGKYCSIASNVVIGPGIHKTDGISTHPSFYLKNTPLAKTFANSDIFLSSKRTVIGNDVWIAEKAVIIDGISIGNGAIIAAGAVVVNDVAPYSIVGGVPAKHLKYRFEEQTITFLEKSEWWNYSEEWFEKNHLMMLDAEKFIKYLKSL